MFGPIPYVVVDIYNTVTLLLIIYSINSIAIYLSKFCCEVTCYDKYTMGAEMYQ